MQSKRNWKEYNEKLVKRGEYYVNPRFLDAWLDEIKKMNQMNHRKVGQPFLYPTSMIEFLAFFKKLQSDSKMSEIRVLALIIPFCLRFLGKSQTGRCRILTRRFSPKTK